MQSERCYLTGQNFKNVKFNSSVSMFEYEYDPVGKVKISLSLAIEWTNIQDFNHPILAGICRNCFEKNEEAPIITPDFIKNNYHGFDYPKLIDEKQLHFLKYLYDNGGKKLKTFNLTDEFDYPICYSDDREQFTSILKRLKKSELIDYNDNKIASRNESFSQLELTDKGIEEVKKQLPKIPMIGLVDQKISTGNKETDEKINHAKDLFFKKPESKDSMRSACETLIHILEPLRHDKFMNEYIKSTDTEDFFIIVNRFDIRHNKESTKNIEHSEQLEWVFYSLLNTISTYTKLKQRLEK